MIKEIFCRMPSDTNYKNNKPKGKFLSDKKGSVIECQNMEETILQRCRVCLGTKKGDVIGDPYFGIDLEDYIYDMGVDQSEIESEVRQYLTEYALMGYGDYYTLNIKVTFGKDVTSPTAPHDYFVIDIYLNEQKALGIIVS